MINGKWFFSPSIIKIVLKILNLPVIKSVSRFGGIEKIARKLSNSIVFSIYPIDIPEITIDDDLDILLVELPPRYMPFMPNGLGYVNNILKKTCVKFQTLDLNIIMYHLFNSARINRKYKKDDPIYGTDLWDLTNMDRWTSPEIINFFRPQFEDVISKIALRKPKAAGISLNGNNRSVAAEFIGTLRKSCPDIVIVVGGYDCVYHHIGPNLFKDFDYMAIGETELTLEPLAKAISHGGRPKNLIGFVSKYDTPDRIWEEPPLLQDLDSVDFPRYEWISHVLYQTFNGRHLIPITSSRGCRWGKCNFCGECFPFRKRSPLKVVEEIEFFTKKGFHTFHFNESDVNGDPQNLFDICSGIIERGLHVMLVGQLRIDRRNTREYFGHLAKAGFKHLRFGVDGWSDNLLKLQRKGYNMALVHQNIKDCHATGIYTSVNMVLGVPGETEEDVAESIDHMVKLRDSIDIVEGINTLILAGGSEYYNHPEKYGIAFRGNKNEIYRVHIHYIPTDLWYSENPFIDQSVRLERLDRICTELYKNKVNIGPFASRVVERLKSGKRHDGRDDA